VNINTNSRDNSNFSFTVKGNSYEKKPQITVKQGDSVISTGNEYDFGSVLFGRIKDVTFTIGNSGEANLNITNVSDSRVNLEDNTSGYFSVVQQPSASVTPGSTTTFIIRYNPPTIGANSTATLKIITDSQNDDEFSIRIKGTGRSYTPGDMGPGGGMVFYVSGNQAMEFSGYLGTMTWTEAVTTANNFSAGGYTNWHLPDMVELGYLRILMQIGLTGTYWSSEAINSEEARTMSMSSGNPSWGYIWSQNRVCAVRTFTF